MTVQPTILMLSGLLCDRTVWAAQRAAFARSANVVIPDFSSFSSIEEMARFAIAQTQGPLIVFGHSMGARVALEIIRLAAERVQGLALIDTGIHTRRDGEEAKRMQLVKLAYEKGMAALADEWLPPMLDPRRVGDQTVLAPLKDMVIRATPEQHERQIQALLDRPDARKSLASIACPTLVMVGRQDRWSPLEQHEEIASLIPGAKLVVIEDSGHMSLVERPAETTEALLNFASDLQQLRPSKGAAEGMNDPDDQIPATPIFDRKRQLQGYRLNKMAMGLGTPANRAAFKADENAYLDRFKLTEQEKNAVRTRDWREMVRLGGNLFFILKISAVDPVKMTEIGAHQAGMDHDAFLRDRLGKKI